MTDSFRVGFGRAVMTPRESTPLRGYGNTSMRMHRNVRDDLYATCVALSDGCDSTVLLYHIDLISLSDLAVEEVRTCVSTSTGVAADRIMLCCTHTHSAPDLFNENEPSIPRFRKLLVTACTDAAEQAMADRKPARIFVSEVETQQMNFVRHYKYVTAEGVTEYFGDNFGKEVMDETTTHATEADPTMHLIKFVRQGGRDVVIANWRAHALLTGGGKRYDLSADFPGTFRDTIEQKLGCLFAYFQGAAGNQNPKSRILTENRTYDCLVFGKLLTEYAMEGLFHAREIPAGPVKVCRRILDGTVRKADPEMLEAAKAVREEWQATNDHALAKAKGAHAGIRSVYHAGAILSRQDMPDTWDLELNAISVGQELAFVTSPNELFDTLSVMTEEGSPFGKTITMGYCNASRGYMPSQLGFDYTCYESDCTRFTPGTGEQIIETFLAMLTELKQQ